MARIPEVTGTPEDPIAREVFESQMKAHGFVFNTAKVYAHRPTIMQGQYLLADGVNASGLLGEGLKALVNVKVTQINGGPSEWTSIYPVGWKTASPSRSSTRWTNTPKMTASPGARGWESSSPSA
jgi:hypothetical protein